ncbi:MAG: DNA-3-methyladenine glycosylase I [Neomegalonema sp.]|nr:DNA-3-methyladenine glycosylase I [Neomegalonema sp.]
MTKLASFETIWAQAADRQGGTPVLREALALRAFGDRRDAAVARLSDDRLLSDMTRRVFQAGFSWSVIDHKWDGFEAAFEGFEIARCAQLNDAALARLATDDRIVKHAKKIESVRDNAAFLQALAAEYEISAAQVIGFWPVTELADLLELFKRKGARLGGVTGQNFLRGIGKESYVLTRDVVQALIAFGAIDKAPASKAAMQDVQAAFNAWKSQSGASMSEISRVLALALGESAANQAAA